MENATDAAANGAAQGLSNSVAQLVEKTVVAIFAGSSGFAGKIQTNTISGFKNYFIQTRNRIGLVKTLISRAEPVRIEDAYQPVDLELNEKSFSIDKLIPEIGGQYSHVVISGRLGAGKSFSLKHIFCKLAENDQLTKIPVFIELRYLDFDSEDIVSYIVRQIRPFVGLINESAIISGLSSGKFVLLLDGFDEIGPEMRDKAGNLVMELAHDYPLSPIVMTSRPDSERFLSWQQFYEMEIQPLTKAQVIKLIRRLKFDEAEKEIFSKRLNSDLYDSHSTLLSNPLLASMMLLTFSEFQDIPSKMHTFYSSAFDVLYKKHDATKVDFNRKFYCSLEQHEFRQLFMTMSFFAYLDRAFGFTEKSLSEYISDAAEYESMNVDASMYIQDLVENVCIMQREGENIAYIHRSFQEYFAGLFLSRRSIDNMPEFVDSILHTGRSDDEAIYMFIEMDREEFERKYLISKLDDLKRVLENIEDTREFFSRICHDLVYSTNIDNHSPYIGFIQGPHNGSDFLGVLRILARYYDMKISYNSEWTREGWRKNLPKKYVTGGQIIVLRFVDISLDFVARVGLSKWRRRILEGVVELVEELNARHQEKSTLLKDRLIDAKRLRLRLER